MFKRNHLFILIIILTTIISCQRKEKINFEKLTPRKSFLYVDHRDDTTFTIKRANYDVNVYLLANKNFFTRGTVILLHGWDLSHYPGAIRPASVMNYYQWDIMLSFLIWAKVFMLLNIIMKL